jgi:nascent polypeptide-associated complex subunit alpha
MIDKPVVYKAPGLDTFIIFGESHVEDMASLSAAQRALSTQMGGGNAGNFQAMAEQMRAGKKAAAGGVEESDDETGLAANDIDLVMTQASVTRGKAIAALRNNNGDMVNAIMELTTA